MSNIRERVLDEAGNMVSLHTNKVVEKKDPKAVKLEKELMELQESYKLKASELMSVKQELNEEKGKNKQLLKELKEKEPKKKASKKASPKK